MVTLTGPAAVAENEAQAANISQATRTPIPSISIGGKSILPSHGYKQNFRKWQIMRDCYAGELTIKSHGERYLSRPKNVKPEDYDSYRRRAYFYNATRRTHTGLLGAMMRKDPEVTLPTGLRVNTDSITLDGMSLKQFIHQTASEMILVSRYGILVDIEKDAPPGTLPTPHFAGYKAEAIYYIRTRLWKGRKIIDQIFLIEEEEVPDNYGTTTREIYRILRLDPSSVDPNTLVYSQQLIYPANAKVNGTTQASVERIVNIPISVQGRTLDYIPFVIINPLNHLPESTDPVLLDLAIINLSHYESTALLEHGRFYAGMPTYYIAGEGNSANELAAELGDGLGGAEPMSVGPSNVWLLEKDDKCGLLEFTGHGLSFIENAVDDKQLQMHSLGGKLIPTQRKAAALSAEAYGLMEAGDEATMLDIALQIDFAFKKALDYANDLQNNIPANNGLVQLNKEFIRSDLTAREVRAIQTLYERRLIPKDVLYYTLRQIGIIPMEYSLEDFTKLLGKPDQLYNDPSTQPIAGGPIYDNNSPDAIRQRNAGLNPAPTGG